jgi:hypothetical protein
VKPELVQPEKLCSKATELILHIKLTFSSEECRQQQAESTVKLPPFALELYIREIPRNLMTTESHDPVTFRLTSYLTSLTGLAKEIRLGIQTNSVALSPQVNYTD